MPKFHFEVEEREIYKFEIDCRDRDQAIRLFSDNTKLYMTDDNLHNIHLDYEFLFFFYF